MTSTMQRFVSTLLSKYRSPNLLLKHFVPVTSYATASRKTYASALFVSGRYANKVYSFLQPYLDFDKRFVNIEKLQTELQLRGLDLDASKIQQSWKFYKDLRTDKEFLEHEQLTLTQKLKTLPERTNITFEDEQLKHRLLVRARVLRQDIKMMREALWDLEDLVMEKFLKLPNSIDQNTPSQTSIVLNRFGALNEAAKLSGGKSHIEIGRALGLLEYKNPVNYYLYNEAALFELAALSYAGKVLSEHKMIRVAGCDFSRSLVVEGSGLNHENPIDSFILESHSDVDENSPNRMHLVGGASLVSFLAMHAKQIINPNHLPINYFAVGRQYTPFPGHSAPIGLFTVSQASTAHVFSIVKDDKSVEYHTQFEEIVRAVSTLYDNICDHYQVVIRPASELRPWESMRVSFELWSSFTKQYVEVGHISACGDYFTKRLLIAYQTPSGRDYPAVISGTVLSIPRLLGCILEQNPEKFVIPKKIAEHMPIDANLLYL